MLVHDVLIVFKLHSSMAHAILRTLKTSPVPIHVNHEMNLCSYNFLHLFYILHNNCYNVGHLCYALPLWIADKIMIYMYMYCGAFFLGLMLRALMLRCWKATMKPNSTKGISYLVKRTVKTDARNQPVPVHGFVFDLDGTLTLPVLDFAELRRRLQCPKGVDILAFCHSKLGKDKEKALQVVEEFEEEGRQNTKLQPGVCELLKFLAQSGLKRALITRNLQASVDQFFDLLGDPGNYGGPFTHVSHFQQVLVL